MGPQADVRNLQTEAVEVPVGATVTKGVRTTPVPVSPSTAKSPEVSVSRPRLTVPALCGFALAAIWLLALLVTTITTANPVTINRQQVEHADAVVLARVDDLDSGKCTIEQSWKMAAPAKQLTIQNLPHTTANGGGRYLLPIRQTGRSSWMVVPTQLPTGTPLIYPATADGIEQLEAALK